MLDGFSGAGGSMPCRHLGWMVNAIKTTAFCVTLQFVAEASYCKLHWCDFCSLQQMLTVSTPFVHHHSPPLDCGNTNAGMHQNDIYHPESILEFLTDNSQHHTEETEHFSAVQSCWIFFSVFFFLIKCFVFQTVLSVWLQFLHFFSFLIKLYA